MSGKYTEGDLAGLSKTERDALTATDDVDNAALEDIIGDDLDDDPQDPDNLDDLDPDNNEPDDPQDPDPQDPAEPNDPATPPAASEPTPVVATEFDLNDVPVVAFVPKLSGEILPAFQAEIDKITASKQADIDVLDSKLEEGEITSAEYRKQVRDIENGIKTETRKLEAASQNAEIDSQLWQEQQKTFFRLNPDFTKDKNPADFEALNKEVIRIANDPATANLSGIQILCLAKNNLVEIKEFQEFKAMKKAGKTPLATEPAAKKDSKPAKPAAKRPEVQTLSNVPVADNADIGQDKFAHLDKLSGMALEKAISNLSAADKEAYLSGV